jgi:hypothetical protein
VFLAKKSKRIYIIPINNMRQFFLPKSTKLMTSRPVFLENGKGLEANNYKKENFKKVIRKVLFGKKK